MANFKCAAIPSPVTVSWYNSHFGTYILVHSQPTRSTQPGHPFVDKFNKYQPKGGDALRLGVKVRWVAGKNFAIPLLHTGHVSALDTLHVYKLYKFAFFTFTCAFFCTRCPHSSSEPCTENQRRLQSMSISTRQPKHLSLSPSPRCICCVYNCE